MIEISIASDVARLTRGLDDIAKRQIPYATALALTGAARAAQGAVTRELPEIFDRPTKFTERAITIIAATKAKPEAHVLVKDRQAQYLAIEETGGTARPQRNVLVIPKGLKRNAYGNMPKGALSRAIARKSTFIGKVHGETGVWQRPTKGKPLTLLIGFIKSAQYQPRFGFVDRTKEAARKAIPSAWQAAMVKAMATAKR